MKRINRPNIVMMDDTLDDKETEIISWIRENPEAKTEAMEDKYRLLREHRLNKHLNSIKTVK